MDVTATAAAACVRARVVGAAVVEEPVVEEPEVVDEPAVVEELDVVAVVVVAAASSSSSAALSDFGPGTSRPTRSAVLETARWRPPGRWPVAAAATPVDQSVATATIAAALAEMGSRRTRGGTAAMGSGWTSSTKRAMAASALASSSSVAGLPALRIAAAAATIAWPVPPGRSSPASNLSAASSGNWW